MSTETNAAIDPKHLAFVEEYLVSYSAAAAYRATHPDCSRETSWTEGAKYLRKPAVQALLKDVMEEKKMSADEVVEQLTRLGRQGSLRALQLLAKVHGLLIDKVDARVEHQISWAQFIANQTGSHPVPGNSGNTDPECGGKLPGSDVETDV